MFTLVHGQLGMYDTCDRRIFSPRLHGISQNFATNATSLQNEVQIRKVKVIDLLLKVLSFSLSPPEKFLTHPLLLLTHLLISSPEHLIILTLPLELRLDQIDCCQQQSCEPGKLRQILLFMF